MIDDAVAEIIVGVARDPQFGLHLVIGAGGVMTEMLKDTATLMIPAAAEQVRASLAGLKVAALLDGFRGAPPGDTDAHQFHHGGTGLCHQKCRRSGRT